MKFPTLSRSKVQGSVDDKRTAADTGLSKNSSESEIEKIGAPSVASKTSHPQGEKILEATPVLEAAALEKLNDEPEYPGGVKLAIITVALCLSVFCMALVCSTASHPPS